MQGLERAPRVEGGGFLLLDDKAGPEGIRMALESSSFKLHLDELSRVERAMLCLSLVHGLGPKEIGFCFGMKEALAKQYVEEVRVRMNGAITEAVAELRRARQQREEREYKRSLRAEIRARQLIEARMDRDRRSARAKDQEKFRKFRQEEKDMNEQIKIEDSAPVTQPVVGHFSAGPENTELQANEPDYCERLMNEAKKASAAPFEMPQIEEGIPIPPAAGPAGREKSPARILAEKLQANQSVLVDPELAKKIYGMQKTVLKKFVSRAEGEKVRVWCVGTFEPKPKGEVAP